MLLLLATLIATPILAQDLYGIVHENPGPVRLVSVDTEPGMTTSLKTFALDSSELSYSVTFHEPSGCFLALGPVSTSTRVFRLDPQDGSVKGGPKA